jgi:hypothetical protein
MIPQTLFTSRPPCSNAPIPVRRSKARGHLLQTYRKVRFLAYMATRTWKGPFPF